MGWGWAVGDARATCACCALHGQAPVVGAGDADWARKQHVHGLRGAPAWQLPFARGRLVGPRACGSSSPPSAASRDACGRHCCGAEAVQWWVPAGPALFLNTCCCRPRLCYSLLPCTAWRCLAALQLLPAVVKTQARHRKLQRTQHMPGTGSCSEPNTCQAQEAAANPPCPRCQWSALPWLRSKWRRTGHSRCRSLCERSWSPAGQGQHWGQPLTRHAVN